MLVSDFDPAERVRDAVADKDFVLEALRSSEMLFDDDATLDVDEDSDIE